MKIYEIVMVMLVVNGVKSDDDENRPHIVFLLVDDLGYNDVGYSKYSKCPNGYSANTPFVDRLAAQGLKFKYSYTPIVCTPSRAAIMSGKYPFRYGLQRGVLAEDEPRGLDVNLKLLPQYMKDLGYSTHLVGKWHLGFCKNAYTPLHRGFDTFFGYLGGGIGYYDHLSSPHFRLDYYDQNNLVYNDHYSVDDYTSQAVGLIKNNTGSKPMFLYLSLQAVHSPLDLVPGSKLGERSLNRHKFLELLEVMDKFTENVVKALKEKGMWKNTVFIFTSDNGGQPIHGGNNYPLRGKKHSLWEGGSRIRTFVHSKKVPKGTYDGLFFATDWLPTLVSIAGGDGDNFDGDGINQWKALKENAKKLEDQPRKSFIYNHDEFVEEARRGNRSAIRYRTDDFDYKLILGSPGTVGLRYDPCSHTEATADVTRNAPDFTSGILYDMSLKDSELEEEEVIGREDIKNLMIDMIMEEKKKGYVSPPSTVESSGKSLMLDSRGFPYAGSGWC